MTAEVPAIAGRPVPVACAPGAGLGHPACYLPVIPVIEVRRQAPGSRPRHRDPASPADRERYPVTWGALIHECAHAAHTLLPASPSEGQLVQGRPPAGRVPHRGPPGHPPPRRPPLAARQRHQLILDDFTAAGADPSSPREAGTAAALLLAREDAGILEPAETAPVAAKVEAAIGTDRLARLRATWREVHQSPTATCAPWPTLARRWCRILGLDPDAAPPAPRSRSALRPAQRHPRGHQGHRRGGRRRLHPAAAPLPARHRRQARAGEGTPGATPTRPPATPSAAEARPRAVTGTRDPRDEEAAAARRLARALRESTAGGRDKVTVTSKVPPGRLRMGKALASRAQRAAGAVPTAEPFTQHPQPPGPRPAAASRHRLRHLRLHGAPSPARSPRPPGSSPAPPGTCPPPSPPPSCSARASTP